MTNKPHIDGPANQATNNQKDEPFFIREEMATYMADIKTDATLYEKTKSRVETVQNIKTPSAKPKRRASFYFAFVAATACVLLIGAIIVIYFDTFYMGRAMEDSSPEMYLRNDEDSVGVAQDSPVAESPSSDAEYDAPFIIFEQQDDAHAFYSHARAAFPLSEDICESEHPQASTSGIDEYEEHEAAPESSDPCYSNFDPYRFLSGTLLAQPKNSIIFDSKNNLLFYAKEDTLFVTEASDTQNINLLSTVDLRLHLEDENATCAAVDLRFTNNTLWVVYSYSRLSSNPDTHGLRHHPLHFTRVERYDFSQPTTPVLMDSFDMDGRHLATETDGHAIIIISEKLLTKDDSFLDEYILPHTRTATNEWAQLDAGQLVHMSASEPEAFVIIAHWPSPSVDLPQIYALSGAFNFFQSDAWNLILIGKSESEVVSLYAQWNSIGLHVGTQPGESNIIIS